MSCQVDFAEGSFANESAECVVSDGFEVVGGKLAVSRLEGVGSRLELGGTYFNSSWYECASCVC